MTWEAISGAFAFVVVFFDEVDKGWYARVEILIALLNFQIWAHILLYVVLSVAVSILEIMVH